MNKMLKFWDYTPAFLLLIILIVINFYLAPFGFDFTDSAFHSYNFSNYRDIHIAFFSYGIWESFRQIGFTELLSFRYICVIFKILTVLLSFILIDWKELTFKELCWYAFFSLGLSRMIYVPGYDIISNFFVTASAVFLLKLFQSDKKIFLYLSGIMAGFAICVRIPNIIFLPLTPFLLLLHHFIQNKSWNELKSTILDIVGFITTTATVVALCIISIYGSLHHYSDSFSVTVTSNHTGLSFIKGYVSNILKMIPYGLIAMGSVTVLRQVYKANQFASAFLLFVGLSITAFFLHDDEYGHRRISMMNALILTFILIGRLYNRKTLILIISIILFSFIPTAGSDTGMLKYALFLYIPLILCMLKECLKEIDLFILYSSLLAINCYIIANVVFRSTFQDVEARHADTELQHRGLHGIYTTKARADGFYAIRAAVEKEIVLGKTVQRYGLYSHVLRYIQRATLYPTSFNERMENNKEVEQFLQYLLTDQARPSVLIVKSYPEASPEEYRIELIDQKLIDNHYIPVHQESYFCLYRYTPDAANTSEKPLSD